MEQNFKAQSTAQTNAKESNGYVHFFREDENGRIGNPFILKPEDYERMRGYYYNLSQNFKEAGLNTEFTEYSGSMISGYARGADKMFDMSVIDKKGKLLMNVECRLYLNNE